MIPFASPFRLCPGDCLFRSLYFDLHRSLLSAPVGRPHGNLNRLVFPGFQGLNDAFLRHFGILRIGTFPFEGFVRLFPGGFHHGFQLDGAARFKGFRRFPDPDALHGVFLDFDSAGCFYAAAVFGRRRDGDGLARALLFQRDFSFHVHCCILLVAARPFQRLVGCVFRRDRCGYLHFFSCSQFWGDDGQFYFPDFYCCVALRPLIRICRLLRLGRPLGTAPVSGRRRICGLVFIAGWIIRFSYRLFRTSGDIRLTAGFSGFSDKRNPTFFCIFFTRRTTDAVNNEIRNLIKRLLYNRALIIIFILTSNSQPPNLCNAWRYFRTC